MCERIAVGAVSESVRSHGRRSVATSGRRIRAPDKDGCNLEPPPSVFVAWSANDGLKQV